MQFWKQFKPKSCSIDLAAQTKDDALREIVANLVKADALPAELEGEAVKALLERERIASTGVGMHVAIPHVKLRGIDRAVCSLSIHPQGLEWAAVDGAPVQIFFTVLRPEKASDAHDPEKHLDMMRWIARLSRDPDFRRFAVKVRTKSALVDLLKEMSGVG
jgi:mannitol/fructose-specific phosphotransferase system IIA component (Ntr-type)